MTKQTILFSLIVACSLSACITDPQRANQQSGALTGAVAGGLLGATVGQGSGQGAATLIGAMIGSAVGSNVGQSMDEQAQSAYQKSMSQGSLGQPVTWESSEYHGNVTPLSNIFYVDGRACRQFRMQVVHQSQMKSVHGIACSYGNHGWRVMSQSEPKKIVVEQHQGIDSSCRCTAYRCD